MKNVRDLTNVELDGLIARIEGIEVERRDYGWAIRYPFDPEGPANEFSSCFNWMWIKHSPSTDWEQGGPIIEREKIGLNYRYSMAQFDQQWAARIDSDRHGLAPRYGHGETPLIAAMRAYVASVYGDEVSDGIT